MNKKILGIVFIIFSYLTFFLGIKYISFLNFSYDLLLVFSCFVAFISLHFFLNVKAMYEFIYKYRYIIGILLLLFITLMKYHGSSIGMWNRYIEPNNDFYNDTVIFGYPRGIKGDEWSVFSLLSLSQESVNFNCTNNLFMAKDSIVSLYPSLPCFDISIIGKILFLPYLFLPIENAFSLSWSLPIFMLLFSSFELLMIVTKKNKLYSLLGAILITFSSASMWWGFLTIISWGNIACLILYKFLRTKKIILKILFSIIMGIVGSNYILLMYPAWQIPFGFIYLGLFIWILVNNKEKLDWRLLLYIPIVLIVISGVVIPTLNNSAEILELVNNTVYPGERFSNGGYGFDYLFLYLITPFYSIKDVVNPCEYSSFNSFYPIPIVISIYYLLKNKITKQIKKCDLFLLILTIILVFLSIWNYVKLPSVFVKASLLSFSIPERTQLIVSFGTVLLLIYLMSKYESDRKITKKELILSIIILIFTYIISIFIIYKKLPNYFDLMVIIGSFILYVPSLVFIILNRKKYNKYVAIYLIILTFITGFLVNPISKGLDMIYEKELAKEIQKIVKNDQESKWATINGNYIFSNYALANGAKIITSTNYYPNFELWNKIDINKKYEDIYNRYAHITMEITMDETKFELITSDAIKVKINMNDICKLDAKYIISEEKLEKYNTNNVKFATIYERDKIYINSLSCN